jgi:4-amino-4-deoxy-L-arabinose transferase-like glycosyltransferase
MAKVRPSKPERTANDFGLSPRMVLAALLLFSLMLRLLGLLVSHTETDEKIYLTLAQKVSQHLFDYNLQGTPILPTLPQSTYNHPIFLRPPLFVYLVALFGSVRAHLFVPLLAGVGVLWTTFLLGKKLSLAPSTTLLACVVLACCPILLFTSVHLWADVLLALMVSLTLLLFLLALEAGAALLFALSGAAFGLAVLTKETAVLILPALLYLCFRRGLSGASMRQLVLFGLPAGLVCFPWFYQFHRLTGAFIKGSGITEENLRIPFIDMMVHRPAYFYFLHIVVLSPIYIFGYFDVVERIRKKESLTEVIWVASYLVPLTIVGLLGQGYQTRYIVPAVPGLALLTADWLYRHRNGWVTVTAITFLLCGLLTGILDSLLFRPADLFAAYEFFWGPLLAAK